MAAIASGVWPTMITPFTEAGAIDDAALEQLVEWYVGRGVDGLFAVCQSSEMFFLTLEERVSLARRVVELAAGRVGVIASGHVSDAAGGQLEELKAIADTGVQAVVLVSNRLAAPDEPDDVWKRNAERLLEKMPGVTFGIYECPYPYKRLLSPELLAWCARTGRFAFLKDTCCDAATIANKLRAVEGSGLKLYNANAATLLDSLAAGAHGYSGVMANFHPDLYVWLHRHFRSRPAEAERLQQFLGLASVIEAQGYPVNAKYHLQLEGLNVGLHSRTRDASLLTSANRLELRQLRAVADHYRSRLTMREEQTAP